MSDDEPQLDDLTAEDVQTLKWLATQTRQALNPSRRQLLTGGAGLLGLAGMSGGVSAQPTGDEGSVGTSGDRVEAWVSEMDALEVTTGQATINDLSAVLEKTSNQPLSADTDTVVDWDSQDVDTDLYTYNASTDELEVLSAGDYVVQGALNYSGLSDQDGIFAKIDVNGVETRSVGLRASGTANQPAPIRATLKDLSQNDTITIVARSTASNDVVGNATQTYVTVTRSG